MTEHTPTPWTVAHRKGQAAIRGPSTECLAVLPYAPCEGYGLTDVFEVGANAAFIAEAVNNHEALKAEVARLTPYVEAFRREETRADKLAREADDLRSELEQAKGQVESLRNALEPFIALRDQSPTQMAKVIHKGIAGTIPIALTVTKDQFKAACSAFGLSPSPSSTEEK